MHDTDPQIEDRLRAALRAEADDLPFTVTIDRLEGRLAERRRTARATRLAGSLAAAAAVIVAVGVAAYALVNRDTAPAATPQPTAVIASPSTVPASPVPSASPSTSPSPTATPVPPIGLAFACGAARFDAALLDTVGTAEQADRPDAAAIREELAHPSLDQAVLPPSGYWLIEEAPTRSVYLSAPQGVAEQYVVLDVEERDGNWAVRSATECRPSVAIDGSVGEATWTWDPAAAAPDASTTTFTALIREYRCSSGQPAADRARGPVIVVQPDRVLIGFAVGPLEGDQDCQGVDPTPVTVTLPEALGDRPLVDGGVYPFGDPRPEAVVPPPATAELPEPTLPEKLDRVTKLLGISGTSANARQTRSVAVPADADVYYLRLGCSGTGRVDVEIDGIAESYDCSAGLLTEYAPDADGQLDLSIGADGVLRYTAAIDARDLDAGPGFHVPALIMHGRDWTAADGPIDIRGFVGCGLSYTPKGGSGSVTDCGASWQPVPTFLHTRPGADVWFTLDDGWTITRIGGGFAEQARIGPSGRAPVSQPWFGDDAGGTQDPIPPGGEMQVAAPPEGDWGVLVYITATKDGAEFSVPYYFRIKAEP